MCIDFLTVIPCIGVRSILFYFRRRKSNGMQRNYFVTLKQSLGRDVVMRNKTSSSRGGWPLMEYVHVVRTIDMTMPKSGVSSHQVQRTEGSIDDLSVQRGFGSLHSVGPANSL